MVRRSGLRAVDLGCGTGELTRQLHDRLGCRETLGLDRSAKMLERSAAFAAPGLRFERESVEDFAPAAPVDLIFSNAALHFVKGHEALLPRLASDYERFLETYRRRLLPRLAHEQPYFFTFKRVLMHAAR